MRLVFAVDRFANMVDAVHLWAAVVVSLAFDSDASICFFAILWCFSGADLVIFVAVVGGSALDCRTGVGFTSALAFGASGNRRVQAVVVRSAVNSRALVIDASLLVIAVLICSAFLDDTLVLFAETMAVFATGNTLGEAHVMTSALDFLAGVGFSVAKLAGTAVIIVSAFLSLARVLVALPVIIVSFLAIRVRVAVDFGATVINADGVLAIRCAVVV